MKRILRKIWKLMKLSIGAWAIAALLAAAAPAQEAPAPPEQAQDGEKKESSAPSAPSAVKPAESKAAPPAFLKAWEKLQAVAELRNAELRRRERAIEELAGAQISLSTYNGQMERLSAELHKLIPEGFRWDPASKSFVPLATEPQSPAEIRPEQKKPQ